MVYVHVYRVYIGVTMVMKVHIRVHNGGYNMMGSTHLCEPRFGRFDGGGRRVHHGVQLGLGQELAVRRRVGVADGIEGPRQLVQAVLVEEHGEVDGVVVAHRVEALPAFAGRGRVCADGHVRAYCRGEGRSARGDEVSVVCVCM